MQMAAGPPISGGSRRRCRRIRFDAAEGVLLRRRSRSPLPLLLLPLLLLLVAAAAAAAGDDQGGYSGPPDEVTTEPGYAALKQYAPPAAPPASAANSRASWPPLRNSPAITFNTLDGGQWAFKPVNGTETALFVLLPPRATHRFLPAFSWGEPQTGMSAWSARPDLHVVFVPLEDEADAQRVFSEAQGIFTDPEDREYWLPRLHFTTDTVAGLRRKDRSRSWLPDLVDAWSEQQPTVAALWPPLPATDAGAGTAAPAVPAGARYLDLFDATPPLSGLKAAAAGSLGACPDLPATAGATCGRLAYYGNACQVNADTPPKPEQDVEGKVALVARGGCVFADKIKAARASGALAAIVYSNDEPRSPWLATDASSGANDGDDGSSGGFPALLIDKAPGQLLKGLLTTTTNNNTTNNDVTVALFQRAAAPWAFASDRFGRLRRLRPGMPPSLGAMVLEATYYEYEAMAEAANPPAPDLGLNPTTLAVGVLENAPAGQKEASVEIPGYITERPNSGLHLRLHLFCPGRDEAQCPPAAQFVKVYACEAHVADPGEATAGNTTTTTTLPGTRRRTHHHRGLAPPTAAPEPEVTVTPGGAAAPIDSSGQGTRGAHQTSLTIPAPDANNRGPGAAQPAVAAVQPRDTIQGDLPGGGATRIWEGCAGEAVELGRLVSPAGREMVTVMDASPMLAALPLKADLSSTASANRNARIKVFVKGSDGYNVSLALLFTAANPGDLVPFQTFRISSLDGAAPTKAAIDSSAPVMIPLPKGVPSYSVVAAITAVPDGGAPVAHMFRIVTGEDTGDGTGAKAPPVEWTVPLMTTSQPFGCSNLTLTRYSGVVPNQLDDWYGTQPGFCKGAPVALKSFSMSRPQDADAGNITITYLVDDFGNAETSTSAGGKRSNPPPGQPGHVDLEAYLVTYAFLPESPVVTGIEYRNTSLAPGDIGVDGHTNATTRITASTLTMRLPGRLERDTQDAVLIFPVPKADPGIARMPVDLYRVIITERVLGESMVFSFPVSSPEAPANAAAQVQVLNITNPPLGASASEPPHRQRRRLLRSLEGDERPRDLQDPNQPWALPPAPRDAAGQDSANGANVPLIPNMELVIRNLKPRNDYLVKLSAVSAAGPSRAAVASVFVPGASAAANNGGMTRDGYPFGPGGVRGGDWGEGEDKSLTAAAKAGLAVGLLAALTVLGILGVHVWRRTSPSRFWELEGVGRGDGGGEGEGLERPTATDAVAAMAALDARGGWQQQQHQHRGRRTHVRGSASAPHLYDGDGGVGGAVGEGRAARSLRREEEDEEEEQEIPIDEDHYRHHHQARRHSGAGAGAAAAASSSSSSMRRSRSASLPSRVSMGSARGGRHSPPSEEPGRVMRSGSDESSLTSHSGSEEGGNNSDPESRGRNFEMV